MDNELTCGSLSKRFSIPGASKGTGTTIFKTIPNFVDILPYSIPLCKMDITARQRLSNDLYSLNNIFSINFIDCESSGCKLSVKYIGRNNLDKILLNQKDIMKKIEIIEKRSVNINIYISPTKEYILTLQHVNPGGLIADKSGKQQINSLITRTFEADEEDKFSSKKPEIGNFDVSEKIKISSDFQNAISFLMGVDIFNTTAITFDILYNSLILRPLNPTTEGAFVLLMIISVFKGFFFKHTPEYPLSESSLDRSSFNSEKKTPSETNFFLIDKVLFISFYLIQIKIKILLF
jgi:hypothetical protein